MDPVTTQMKAVSSGLNQAVEAGRELEKSIKNVNSFMNEEVNNQAHIRAAQRKKDRFSEINREEIARLRLDEKKQIERRKQQIRDDIVKKYGKDALSLYNTCLTEVKKEEEIEKKAQDKDKAKLTEFKWLCFLAAAAITTLLASNGII